MKNQKPKTKNTRALFNTKRLLVLGWGIVCRAGVLFPFRRPKPAYVYLKRPSRTFRFFFLPRPFFVGMANSLIVLSLAGLILTFYPIVQAELAFRRKQIEKKKPLVARAYFGDILALSNTGSENTYDSALSLSAPDPAFSIVISKIEAKAKVIANVDTSSQKIYDQALRQGVAHAAGSSFPGSGETVWLFAHSTDSPWNVVRYNAVFFLLRKLEPGDEVVVFFANRRFNYQVFETKTVEANDTSFLANQGEERLVLQTCWPPGTTLKRLIVLAKPTAT